MRRIHFTADDLARIRLKATVGPVAETVFALGLLGRPGGPGGYPAWRRQVTARLREHGMLDVVRARSDGYAEVTEDLLRLVDQSEDADEFFVRMMKPAPEHAPHVALTRLFEVWRVAVAPYWNRILSHLESDVDARGRIEMTGGVERLFTTLHPRISWKPPVLEIPGDPSGDFRLDGQGLVLSPSIFLADSPGRLIGAAQPALVFGIPLDSHQRVALWDDPDDSTQALGMLVGQTRAAALRALRESCTTSRLADLLGISMAGASQHAAVLRHSGLVTTRRVRNTVVHTVTPLGVALLGGRME
ncbi:winged helix-turn-helix transcriptional regulator [Amycolatopsis rhizosphaerae]|uniref:Winged helix-turn-helix transcriptional regulator n=1 Tax=Amycolatopsis rhizosphaerae TaxID=2053003 RepID=A0A558CJI4_9PSEU|nr:helix-turn-helix domain-containing protein [Amycolatopsis rhizosphaerae]TVT48882.1 winged helix-turn-helix transcriptional regulator [Amycolatopsis rhizosphaerae]